MGWLAKFRPDDPEAGDWEESTCAAYIAPFLIGEGQAAGQTVSDGQVKAYPGRIGQTQIEKINGAP